MADPKRAKRIAKSKMRLVAKSKWELPLRGSKSYWNEICEGIESKVKRVRNSSASPPTLYPGVSSSIRSSASSVSSNDINVYDFTNRHLAAKLVDSSAPEPIVKIYPPSPPSRDSTTGNASGLPHAVKFQSNPEQESNGRVESLESHWRITKLSKMTKLVNDFLSSTRTRVRPSSAKSLASPLRKSEPSVTRKAGLTRDKSFEHQSKDDASDESSISTMTAHQSKDKTAGNVEGAHLERRSVIFREDIEEIVERFEPNEVITNAKPRRPRAPSLSVASAVPSFGRVVISIESISSIEDEEEHGKTKSNVEHTLNLVSKDRSEPTDSPLEVDGEKVTQNFLRVPEIRTMASSSYPGHDRSSFQQQSSLNKMQPQFMQTKEVFKSKLRTESQVLQKKYGFWPKRSIVHVFRALKAMKHGARSKGRIESEMNRFFAAPLEIYSPSGRSSISSDDRTDFIESQSGHNDEYEERNGSGESIDGESHSSYASVRERLMRNAGAHIGKDFQRTAATCIDGDNALVATSAPADSSRFYNSWSSAGDELKVNHRNKKTSAPACFIAVPRIARIFPRIKADKCLACMCQSLKEINQTARQQAAGRFSNEDNEMVRSKKSLSELSSFECPNKESFDLFYRLPVIADDSVENFLGEDQPGRYFSSTVVDKNDDSTTVEIPSVAAPGSAIGSLTRSSSQLDVSHQSRTIGKAPKALVSAKSVISSLSLASERSKSISDQDDSDQGCIDSGGNDIGLSAGGTSKNLASCHLPTNLKPSLEPLKALRQKKSRSIRSRVASAEKSAGSVSDDEDDSDDDANNRKLPVNVANIKSGGNDATVNVDIDGSTGRDSAQAIDAKQNVETDESQSTNESEKTRERMETVSSKTHPVDDKKSKTLLKGFYDEPIISDREVIKIATRCLNENKTVPETLRVLAKEYSNRLSNALYRDNRMSRLSNVRKNEKIARNLLTLLVDSKSYLNRGKWPNEITHLSFSSKQPPLCNSRQLRRVLPLKSYNLVAPILGMAKWYPKRRTSDTLASSKVDTRHKETRNKAFDLIVHPPSRMAPRVSFEPDCDDTRPKLSPYALFLTKPRRKAVTWRPLTERDLEGYDPEATLKMRATKITDRICEDFCQWVTSLAAGTNQASGIDVNVIKDMFETDFTAEVCRTMQMSINEMSMVPDAVATARNCPGAGELALTRRHLVEDAKAEMKPRRTVGFGTALPSHLKSLPPRNAVDEKWLQCENVPTDLETMDAVWKDITHLSSVKGFIDWLKAHPRVSRPKALEKTLASKETLATRQSQEFDDFKDLELDLDQIRSLKVGDNDPDVF